MSSEILSDRDCQQLHSNSQSCQNYYEDTTASCQLVRRYTMVCKGQGVMMERCLTETLLPGL